MSKQKEMSNEHHLTPSVSQEVALKWPEPIIPRQTITETGTDLEYLRLILNSRVYDVSTETPLTFAAKVQLYSLHKSCLKDLIVIFT